MDKEIIEINNPGGLVKWLKPEDFGKYSRPRNQIIASLLSKTEYIEEIGSGINRIRNAMKEAGLSNPLFEYNYSFMTILNDKTGGIGETTTQKTTQKILELIQQNPEISTKELGVKLGERLGVKLGENEAEILREMTVNKFITSIELAKKIGISTTAVENNISKLKEKGILERIGPDKGGHWEIIGNKQKESKNGGKDENK